MIQSWGYKGSMKGSVSAKQEGGDHADSVGF
jgi:hypothetical protein